MADTPTPGAAAELPVVAWRIKHPSEPGMIGHYPWSYSERATKRTFGFDEEPLVRLPDAQAQLDALREEVARLTKERDAANARIDRAVKAAEEVFGILVNDEVACDRAAAELGSQRSEVEG